MGKRRSRRKQMELLSHDMASGFRRISVSPQRVPLDGFDVILRADRGAWRQCRPDSIHRF